MTEQLMTARGATGGMRIGWVNRIKKKKKPYPTATLSNTNSM
jgi:hypothetical protein